MMVACSGFWARLSSSYARRSSGESARRMVSSMFVMIVSFEKALEGLAGREQARLHRARGKAVGGGDLIDPETLAIVQADHQPLVDGQLRDRLAKVETQVR